MSPAMKRSDGEKSGLAHLMQEAVRVCGTFSIHDSCSDLTMLNNAQNMTKTEFFFHTVLDMIHDHNVLE
jgi:hypothetical protein